MRGPSKNRFEAIFRDGRRVNGEFFRVIAQPGSGLVGFATSKKIGNKPQRNRAKRRAREAARKSNLDPRLDYVVVVQAEAPTAQFVRLVEDLASAIERMRDRWANELESS